MLRTAWKRRSGQKVPFALTPSACKKSVHALAETFRNAGRHIIVGLGLTALAFATTPANAATSSLSSCAWAVEAGPEGLGNFTIPDTLARYWYILIDPQWIQMTIKGRFPNVRFMSFTAYNGESPTGIAGDLFDAQITPDPGSTNPFVPPRQRGGKRNYTVVISRSQTPAANAITIEPGGGWLLYRLYLPNAGENTMGGVPLPSVTVTDQSGTHPLSTCAHVNLVPDVDDYLNLTMGNLLTSPPVTEPLPPTDRLWLAPPDRPPLVLLPNPDNKYMAMFPGPLQPGRIIVIRGKGPSFPDTYNGTPIWRPADDFKNVQLRFWSLCQADLQPPFPSVQCTADLTTKLDKNGFYTIVITDDRIAPDWLPAEATWIPWGDEQLSKILAFRNQAPAAHFHHAVQDAVDHGCTFKLDFPNVPSVQDLEQAGRCAKRVMGAYYPVAAWCNQSDFIVGGADACLKAQ